MNKMILPIIIAAVCLGLLIAAYGAKHGSKQLTIKEACSIVLINEEDRIPIEITDADAIEKITAAINSFSLKKGKSIQNPPGWAYQLIWRDAGDKIFAVVGIVDENTIGHNDHYYSISDGRIDMVFLRGLAMKEDQ